MTRLLALLVAAAALPLSPARIAAAAATECQARTLVAVTDDLGHLWQPGTVLPVDIERDTATGASLCAHGGSCLPRIVAGSPALTLLNCKRGPALGNGDFRLVPDASLAGTAAARKLAQRQHAEEKLSGMGFSNAAAGSLADTYIHQPRSRQGRLVARALSGSAAALASLKRSEP